MKVLDMSEIQTRNENEHSVKIMCMFICRSVQICVCIHTEKEMCTHSCVQPLGNGNLVEKKRNAIQVLNKLLHN